MAAGARSGTREALLEAAASLLAEKGFETVSVREITGLAQANVASVNYHFGSRDGLIDAVVEKMTEPVNRERLERIDGLEAAGEPTVRQLLEAFFDPLFAKIQGSPMCKNLFVKLMGRMVGDRPYQFSDDVMAQFRNVARRFVQAFINACPGLTPEDVFWRIHFSFGVMSNTLTHRDLLTKVSEGMVNEEELEVTMTRVLDFCEAGFKR
ncbi:MAG: TetR family transcriptional regulator [Akkermansiaceae bacterium]